LKVETRSSMCFQGSCIVIYFISLAAWPVDVTIESNDDSGKQFD